MLKLILALSCAIIICECGFVKRTEVCMRASTCIESLQNLRASRDSNLTRVCLQTVEFKDCLVENKQLCNSSDVTEVADYLLENERVLCSDQAKDVISALHESDCVRNAIKNKKFNSKTTECVYRMEAAAVLKSDPRWFCVYTREYATCLQNVWTENSCVSNSEFLFEFLMRLINHWENCFGTEGRTRRSEGTGKLPRIVRPPDKQKKLREDII